MGLINRLISCVVPRSEAGLDKCEGDERVRLQLGWISPVVVKNIITLSLYFWIAKLIRVSPYTFRVRFSVGYLVTFLHLVLVVHTEMFTNY